jgi:hypothetical protein
MSETGHPEEVHAENTNRDNGCLKVALEAMSNSINGVSILSIAIKKKLGFFI